jgi:hypothetical protein
MVIRGIIESRMYFFGLLSLYQIASIIKRYAALYKPSGKENFIKAGIFQFWTDKRRQSTKKEHPKSLHHT